MTSHLALPHVLLHTYSFGKGFVRYNLTPLHSMGLTYCATYIRKSWHIKRLAGSGGWQSGIQSLSLLGHWFQTGETSRGTQRSDKWTMEPIAYGASVPLQPMIGVTGCLGGMGYGTFHQGNNHLVHRTGAQSLSFSGI